MLATVSSANNSRETALETNTLGHLFLSVRWPLAHRTQNTHFNPLRNPRRPLHLTLSLSGSVWWVGRTLYRDEQNGAQAAGRTTRWEFCTNSPRNGMCFEAGRPSPNRVVMRKKGRGDTSYLKATLSTRPCTHTQLVTNRLASQRPDSKTVCVGLTCVNSLYCGPMPKMECQWDTTVSHTMLNARRMWRNLWKYTN